MKLWLLLVLVLSFVGCASLPHYTYTHNTANNITIRIVDVYIDKTFAHDDKIAIDNALNDWNYALNNYIRFNVKSTSFDMEPNIIRKVLDEHGLIFLKINSNSSLVPTPASPKRITLAFTDRIDGNFVYVITDRIRSGTQMEEVIRHEIGHVLGLQHSTSDDALMSPHLSRDYAQCIDYDAIKKVAIAQHLNIMKLNYCSYE